MILQCYAPITLMIHADYRIPGKVLSGALATSVRITVENPAKGAAHPIVDFTIARTTAKTWPTYAEILATVGKLFTADNKYLARYITDFVCRELNVQQIKITMRSSQPPPEPVQAALVQEIPQPDQNIAGILDQTARQSVANLASVLLS